jgi:hypothetical protein
LLAALLVRGESREEAERSVRILGAAETLRGQNGTPVPPIERAFYEQIVAAAWGRLGAEVARAAWAEGQALAIEDVIDLALSGG